MMENTTFRIRLLTIWLLFFGSLPGVVHATDISLKQQVKAAYLYRFCHYISWPEAAFNDATSPIEIAVVGADEVARELRHLTRGRDIGGRAIAVHSYTLETLPELPHILFIGHSTVFDPAYKRRRLNHKPILLVTETPDGLQQGSSINFLMDDERVRFDISLTNIRAHQLQASSRLLSVARQVEGQKE